MRYLSSLLAIFLLFISCHKKQEAPLSEVTPPEAPLTDNFFYRDIEPDIAITVNWTRDTTATVGFIDMDGDQVNDFKIVASAYTHQKQGGHSGPIIYHLTNITLVGMDYGNEVESYPAHTFDSPCRYVGGACPFIAAQDSGIVIDKSQNYFGTYLYDNDPEIGTAGKACTFTGNKYLGVIVAGKNVGWIKVEGFGISSSTLIFKETCLNKGSRVSIITGQKK